MLVSRFHCIFFSPHIYLFGCAESQLWQAGSFSCSSRAPQLWHAGSLVAACVWDLVPWPGIEPGPPELGVWSLNHCTTREVSLYLFLIAAVLNALLKVHLLFFFNLFILLFYLFIYFGLCWVFVAARGLSLVVASGGYSSLWCTGFSFWWLLLLRSTGSRLTGFSSCGMWAQQLWCTGLVALRHVGSSWTRA